MGWNRDIICAAQCAFVQQQDSSQPANGVLLVGFDFKSILLKSDTLQKLKPEAQVRKHVKTTIISTPDSLKHCRTLLSVSAVFLAVRSDVSRSHPDKQSKQGRMCIILETK
jgi:hypothetical protein